MHTRKVYKRVTAFSEELAAAIHLKNTEAWYVCFKTYKIAIFDDDSDYYLDRDFYFDGIYNQQKTMLLSSKDCDQDFVNLIAIEYLYSRPHKKEEDRYRISPLTAMIEINSWDVDMLMLEMLSNGKTINEIAEQIQRRAGPAKARQFLKEHLDGVEVRQWVKQEYNETETQEKILALLDKKK